MFHSIVILLILLLFFVTDVFLLLLLISLLRVLSMGFLCFFSAVWTPKIILLMVLPTISPFSYFGSFVCILGGYFSVFSAFAFVWYHSSITFSVFWLTFPPLSFILCFDWSYLLYLLVSLLSLISLCFSFFGITKFCPCSCFHCFCYFWCVYVGFKGTVSYFTK